MNNIDETLALHRNHKQECNIKNRTIFYHDNLEILQGINSECIDLIYLDPPFNKKKLFIAPTGTTAEGASFKDIFYQEDLKDEWLQTIEEDYFAIYELLNAVKNIEGRKSYNFCYLAYMAIRLIEMRRILKDTGSLYLHCDHTMSHYLKILLDCIFGEKNFQNEIIWKYGLGGSSKKTYSRKHDTIYFYTKSDTYYFDKPREPSTSAMMQGKAKGKIDVWDIPSINNMAHERIGYPTQKPMELLEIVIKASSKKGGIVLDPFCGCATTCVAAEKLERHWIGIDISIKAYELVQQRIKSSEYNAVKPSDINFFTSPPKRTDGGL